MPQFAVDTTYVSDRALLDGARPEHRAYVRELAERGVVLLAGPWADDRGGFIVYQVADHAELDEVLADDPYTIQGVAAERTVREWKVLLGAWRPEQ